MFRLTVTSVRRACATAAFRRTTTRSLSSHILLRQPHLSPSTRPIPAVIRRNFSDDVSQSTKKCSSCGAPLPTNLPACPSCFTITPLDAKMSYYEIMDIPDDKPFSIDTAALKKNFRHVQRVIHPDKWSSKGPDAQLLAAEMSSAVNKAYKTLLDPVSRIGYVLANVGIEVGETEELADKELLVEIMEAREALEEAEDQADVDEIRTENADRIKEVIEQIETLVESENWEVAKTHAIKLKYLQGIDAAAEAWPNSSHDH
ncbi:Co-chaperone Hsc20 [Trametopsis cervina]|nr:Co-chaperone Hsc20 [Trametopsis cervina]